MENSKYVPIIPAKPGEGYPPDGPIIFLGLTLLALAVSVLGQVLIWIWPILRWPL